MEDNNGQILTVQQVLDVIEELAPPELAASWDSIGLQAGDPARTVRRALVALDASEAVINDAATKNCELIIVHHPLIFTPISSLRLDVPEQKLICRLIVNQISLIAAHTNLDAAPGGVADCLADALQLSPTERLPIGSFGRMAELSDPVSLIELLARVKRILGSCGCRINTDIDRPVRRLAVFPGSFSEETLPMLMVLGVDALICGELKHHQGLMLAARGIAAIDTGHDVSERIALQPLADRLAEKIPQITFAVSVGLDYNKMAF